ncbi:hypothetical protein [Sphingobacterium sp. SYP-B4668]|uniref:hypothetical protein n=1 Tax=Sphingobacterium sp. SYP-B4668 TaxID=2996035 RepID=UPI0022DD615C|nr:hypothetical protein [Sphingobacterium sp. SYP-B4668]
MKSIFNEVEKLEMSIVEIEKMLNVLLLRISKGYSQYELSFLLGQEDFYVRKIEGILHTLEYKIEKSNMLRQIFNCGFPAIVPNINVSPRYTIKVFEHKDDVGNTISKAEKRFENGTVKEIATFGTEDKEILLPSASTITEEEVMTWVLAKCQTDYFNTSKTALQIFKNCEAELDQPIRPLFLANALKSCNGTKGLPKINKEKDDNARFVYDIKKA